MSPMMRLKSLPVELRVARIERLTPVKVRIVESDVTEEKTNHNQLSSGRDKVERGLHRIGISCRIKYSRRQVSTT